MKQRNVRNTVWLTADIHYTAAHYFNPEKAQFTDFLPFWEFVSGPLHAGTFGPNVTDNTLRHRSEVPEVKSAAGRRRICAPSAGMQFFGEVQIDPKTRVMTVVLRDLAGSSLFTQTLEA